MPWLFATLATSTPPAASASNAARGGAERELLARRATPIGDRRLEVDDRDVGAGEDGRDRASTSAGEAARRSRIGLSKWMSPPNASVTGFPLPSLLRVGAAGLACAGVRLTGLRSTACAGGVRAADAGPSPPRPTTTPTASAASAHAPRATTSRRRRARRCRRRARRAAICSCVRGLEGMRVPVRRRGRAAVRGVPDCNARPDRPRSRLRR